MNCLLYQDNMAESSTRTIPTGKPVIRSVPALSRGIAVLRMLANSPAPLGVHDIARHLQLVPSTCLHILRVLVAERLIAVDPATKKYSVSSGLVALARSALRQNTLPLLAQSDLEAVSARYGATAIVVEASGLDHMIVVALARSASPLQIHVDIGSRFPALISATGRCIAAFGKHPWAEIKAKFDKLKWDAPPTLADWREEIEATRRSGFAVDDGRYIMGVTIVAAPIAMPNETVSALVLVGVSEAMRQAGLTQIGQDLRERAAQLSRRLAGGTPA